MDFKEDYRPFYADLYEFHKKYCNITTSAEWAELLAEANKLNKKYNTEYVSEILRAAFREIERCYDRLER